MISAQTLETLKAADPDRCRAAVFADKAGRARLTLLYAFHHELAKVPEFVSEPMLGEIRYQWWRDTVEEIYSGGVVRKHDVTTPLAEMFRETDMPRFWADRLINGRSRDLDPTPFENIAAAREYCRDTSGLLMQMAARCLAADADDDAVLRAGEAWGLTGLVRGWAYYKDSMLSQIDRDTLLAAAHAQYAEAGQSIGAIPADLTPAMAYTALIPGFLARHKTQPPKPYSALAKQARLLRTALTGKLPR